VTAAAAVLTAIVTVGLLPGPSAEAQQRTKAYRIGILTMPRSLLLRADHIVD
jgi:hypothetical protein